MFDGIQENLPNLEKIKKLTTINVNGTAVMPMVSNIYAQISTEPETGNIYKIEVEENS